MIDPNTSERIKKRLVYKYLKEAEDIFLKHKYKVSPPKTCIESFNLVCWMRFYANEYEYSSLGIENIPIKMNKLLTDYKNGIPPNPTFSIVVGVVNGHVTRMACPIVCMAVPNKDSEDA